MEATSTSASVDETTRFHTAVECLSSVGEMGVGDRSGAGSLREHKSEYFSVRAEEMVRTRNQFPSAVEHEIEHSKPHRSELLKHKLHEDELTLENRKVFAELVNDPLWVHPERGPFFKYGRGLIKLGRKIAEGGQADIFEFTMLDGSLVPPCLLKVFSKKSHLSVLKKQWLSVILQREVLSSMTHFGIMLDDGRFAFMLYRCWGDLRKLIDEAVIKKNAKGPPFPYEWKGVIVHVESIMGLIARHMVMLHKQDIIHRDLKAANILVELSDKGHTQIFATDFESSNGVVGTGYWRAPEILSASKNGSEPNFTKKVDVYSYGMVCYELVTGCFPFCSELENRQLYLSDVIKGRRPKLPSDLDVTLKDLIGRCWNQNPDKRPSFEEIVEDLKAFGVPL